MKQVLAEVWDGTFAREWMAEYHGGSEEVQRVQGCARQATASRYPRSSSDAYPPCDRVPPLVDRGHTGPVTPIALRTGVTDARVVRSHVAAPGTSS
jgi:hypothetical protein